MKARTPNQRFQSIEKNLVARHTGTAHPGFSESQTLAAQRVSVIVPAFNEGGRIGRVVSVLCQVKQIAQIIVVDDGSRDGTANEARRAAGGDSRFQLVRHKTNRGKGQALFSGLTASRAPYLLLIDADLVNLTPQHIQSLIDPVLAGQAEMTLGQFKNGYWRSDLTHWLTPWLSGQRCIRASLLRQLDRDAASGYGFETALTLAAQGGHWRVERVGLPGVTHMMGDVPHGWRGPWNKVKMFSHIGRAWMLAGYWKEPVVRMARRVRFGLVLVLALGLSAVNSCSLNLMNWQHRLLASHPGGDDLMVWWGKLKATIDLLQ